MKSSQRTPSYTTGALIAVALVGGFLAAFLIYPVLYVFKEAFWVEGRFSLKFFAILFKNPTYLEAIRNSLCMALATTVATAFVAVPLGFIGARYSFRGKAILTGLLLVPMIMPPFVGAIGMFRLLTRGGSINLLLAKLGLPTFDFMGAGGFWAIVALQVLHLYPIMYLNVAASLANVDPSLEEAARNMGDSGLRLFRKITFPLMMPGFFAGAVLVFIWSFTDLGTPLIFSYRRVVAVQIFDMISNLNANPMAYALVVVVILLTATAFLLGRTYLGKRGYEMLYKGASSRADRPAGRWLTVGIWAAIGLLLMVALLPHLSVLLTSIAGRWSDTILPTTMTTQHYGQAFSDSMAMTGVRNSLLLSTASMFLDIVLGIVIAYILTRKRFPGVEALDLLAMLPLALPGLVLAVGYVACFRNTPLDPRGNPFPILIVAYAVRRLPYMVRAAVAGFQQTSVSLEEAAMNVGATPARAVFKITLPLIMANLIAGAILTFSFAMLEVSDSLILASKMQHFPLTKAIYALHQVTGSGDFIASAMGVLAMLLLAGTLIAASVLLGKKMGQLFRV